MKLGLIETVSLIGNCPRTGRWGAEFSLSKLALHPYLHMFAAMRVQVVTLMVGQFLIHNGVPPQMN